MRDTLVNVLVGAAVTVALTPLLPFAPVVGGGVAGYLDSARESRPFREERVFRHSLSEPRTEQGGSESRQLR
jgi:hypothetical protein